MRALAAALMLAASPAAAGIVGAEYADPTTRYAHGVLGDAIEHGALVVETDDGRRIRFVLPDVLVFEDTAPRLLDVDGDGDAEVVTVESHAARGARLSIWDETGRIATTDHIGQTNRWLAPVGLGGADLDGDGAVELAYVDRPHLAKTLRVFRWSDGALVPLADLPGVTNHRIGETDIAGGIRDCGAGPEIVVASADWARVLGVSFDGAGFGTRDLGPHRGRESFRAAIACE